MRWPVSAARVDAIVAGWESALQMVEQRASVWERIATERKAEYDKLMEAFVALRVSGANAPQSVGLPPAQRPAKPADEAIETVVARFGGNSRLRRQLQKYVYTQRLANVDEDKIAESVLVWRDPEDDEDVA